MQAKFKIVFFGRSQNLFHAKTNLILNSRNFLREILFQKSANTQKNVFMKT